MGGGYVTVSDNRPILVHTDNTLKLSRFELSFISHKTKCLDSLCYFSHMVNAKMFFHVTCIYYDIVQICSCLYFKQIDDCIALLYELYFSAGPELQLLCTSCRLIVFALLYELHFSAVQNCSLLCTSCRLIILLCFRNCISLQ